MMDEVGGVKGKLLRKRRMAEEKQYEKELAAAVIHCYSEYRITSAQGAAHHPYFLTVQRFVTNIELQSSVTITAHDKFSQRQSPPLNKAQGDYHTWLCVLQQQELLSSLVWADVVATDKNIALNQDKLTHALVWFTALDICILPVVILRILCLTHQAAIVDSAEKLFRAKRWDVEVIRTCKRKINESIKYLDSRCREPIYSCIFSPEVSAAQLAQTGMACLPRELLDLVAQYFVVDRQEVYTRLLTDKKLFHPSCFE